MAQSTAEQLASSLPQMKLTKGKSLFAFLWRRNRGYLNRKVTSSLLDLLEVLSLAILSDVDSLKSFYVIWIIFYFSQNVLESLFYTARKFYVYDKKLPSKRVLTYTHILVGMIPLFFTMASFERFSHNNIALTYLLFKAALLTIQIFMNYLNFEVQTLSRVYYPPLMNWMILVSSIIIILTIQKVFGPTISFYAVLFTIAGGKVTQDLIMFIRAKKLKATILWQIKRDKILYDNAWLEFISLICIEVFLPISILSLPHRSINLSSMASIFFIYMIVKLFMRPIRSLILDLWSLGIKNHKHLVLGTYSFALMLAISILVLTKTPYQSISIAFMYFNLLMLWNTKLMENKYILLLLSCSLIGITLGTHLYIFAVSHLLVFYYMFWVKFRLPSNLLQLKKIESLENKFVITFHLKPKWAKLARQYPLLRWSPIGKRSCIIETRPEDHQLQSFVLNHSYEVKLIESLSLKLKKKLNLP